MEKKTLKQISRIAILSAIAIVLRLAFSALPNIQPVLAGLMGIVYGILIDTYSALLFSTPILAYIIAGMTFNLAHAISTLFFYPIILSIFRRLLSHEKNN